MANLLSWVGHQVNQDFVHPIAQAAHTVYSGVAAPVRLAAGEITHNNQAIQNARASAPTPLQFAGGALTLGSLAAGGGLYKGAESLAAPIASPLLRRVATNVIASPLGGVFSGGSALSQGANLKQSIKPFALGTASTAALGAATPVIGKGIKVGAKNLARYDQAQNQIGAVGKNVNKPSPALPKVTPKTPSTPVIGKIKAGQGSGLNPKDARAFARGLTTTPAIPKPVKGVKGTGLVNTVSKSSLTSKGLQAKLAPLQGDRAPLGNKQIMRAASRRIASDPNAAYQFASSTHSAEGNATAIQIAKQLESQGKFKEAADLMTTKAQQALQAGQGNQIYSLWDKLSPETIAQTAAKTIEKYNATARNKIPGLTPEQYQSFVDQAKNLQGLKEGTRERGLATQQLLKQIGSLVPSATKDKAFSLYRTGLLTGFRTPGKVGVSHLVSSTAEQVKNIPAVGADKLMSVFTGKRGLSLTLKGNLRGAKQGTIGAIDNMAHGYRDPITGGNQPDFTNDVHFGKSLAGKAANAYVQGVTRLHSSIYQPFFGAQHFNSLYDMAVTNAKNAGLSGAKRDSFVTKFIKNAIEASKTTEADPRAEFSTPEGAAARAKAEAQYTTFQNPTVLSKAAAGVKRSTPGARYIVPFSQIPSSIASKIVDYSPVGAIKEAIVQAKNGTFDQRALSQAIGRSTTGTGLLALGYHLFNNGHITTEYPTDPKERAQWKLEGKQANSILVGGKWRQLASLGPAGDAIGVGAATAQGMQGNKKTPGSVSNAAVQGAFGGLNVLSNSPYLQGLENVGSAIKTPGTTGTKVVEGLAGGLVPTGIANIASATDPLQRQTNSPVDSVTNKIPGLREKNLPQVDVLGTPIPRQQGALGNLVDPFYSTTARSNPLTNELQRLDSTFNTATPSPLTKNQSIGGQKLTLNPKQLTQLQLQSGGALAPALNSLIKSPSYKSADDQTKANAINAATTSVRTAVKNTLAGDPNAAIKLNPSLITANAKKSIDKQNFLNSGKSYAVIGNNIWTLDAAGNATAQTKDQYAYSLGTATLTQMKDNGDLQGYVSTAQKQLNLIDKQLKDPSISSNPLEVTKLQNEAYTLQKDVAKYVSYGGFTKYGSGAKPKTVSLKIPSSKIKTPKISARGIKGGGGKAFKAPRLAGQRTPKSTKLAIKSSKPKIPKSLA